MSSRTQPHLNKSLCKTDFLCVLLIAKISEVWIFDRVKVATTNYLLLAIHNQEFPLAAYWSQDFSLSHLNFWQICEWEHTVHFHLLHEEKLQEIKPLTRNSQLTAGEINNEERHRSDIFRIYCIQLTIFTYILLFNHHDKTIKWNYSRYPSYEVKNCGLKRNETCPKSSPADPLVMNNDE